VLALARRAAKGKKKLKVPQDITEEDTWNISFLSLVLEPFAELTDDLQADGVTSSLVILGFLNAVKSETCFLFNIKKRLSDY